MDVLSISGKKDEGYNRCRTVASNFIGIDSLGFASPKGDGRNLEYELGIVNVIVNIKKFLKLGGEVWSDND